ncbi:MAG: AAA family ATPase, partial [Leptolyngbya sp. SIO1D8]|nr:AAA family ATPase [Leptolyngbya sp. SIO1D8]
MLLASRGYTVILDAKFDRQATRQAVMTQVQAQNLPFTIVHCTAPMETLKQRVQKRQGDIADATLDVLEKQTLETFTEAELHHLATVDTTQSLSSQLAAIVGA